MATESSSPSNAGDTPTAPEAVVEERREKQMPDDEAMIEYGYLERWPEWRRKLAAFLRSGPVDFFLTSVVIYNLFVVVAETDQRSKFGDESTLQWVDISNSVLLAFYTTELVIRLFTLRKWFFVDRLNWLDFGLIAHDLIMLPVSAIFGDVISLSFLRVFRLARLGRSYRVIRISPELGMLLKGLVATLRSIFVSTIVIFALLTIWSILAVEFIQPINLDVARTTDKYKDCERCERAFQTVLDANLTFFQQLITGDSWGQVTIPVIEQNPWTVIFFVTVQVSISIGLMNLLLAVIVDRANEARHEDIKAELREEQEEKKKMMAHLTKVCQAMDTDGGGHLSLEELRNGYEENSEFELIMKKMDIGEDDIGAVFSMMDSDKSGSVLYDEFVEQLWKMKSTDQQTMLTFIKYYVFEVHSAIEGKVVGMEQQVLKEMQRIYFILAKLINYETAELNELEIIRQNTSNSKQEGTAEEDARFQAIEAAIDAKAKMPKTITCDQPSASGQGDSKQAQDSSAYKDIVALRGAQDETSLTVKQCLTQLQQLEKLIQTEVVQPLQLKQDFALDSGRRSARSGVANSEVSWPPSLCGVSRTAPRTVHQQDPNASGIQAGVPKRGHLNCV